MVSLPQKGSIDIIYIYFNTIILVLINLRFKQLQKIPNRENNLATDQLFNFG